jgi:hypothetical protein
VKEVRIVKVSAYSVFSRDRQESLKQSNPELTLSDRTAQISAEWKKMLSADKIPFLNAAKRETRTMQRHSVDEESWDENHSDDSSS